MFYNVEMAGGNTKESSMEYDPEKHHRRSIRLRGDDYAQGGAYFVTIVTKERAHMFGEIEDDQMQLNSAGRMVEQSWLDTPDLFENVELDVFMVMPNHIHGIVVIRDDMAGEPKGTAGGGKRTTTLGGIVRAFKAATSRHLRLSG